MIFIYYLKKQKTITAEYYVALLSRFHKKWMKRRSHFAKKKVFHHDNALIYSSAVATVKLVDLLYELVPHLPCFPDLALCDFFLFPNINKWLTGKKFLSNEEVIAETEGYLADLKKSYILGGLKKLENF